MQPDTLQLAHIVQQTKLLKLKLGKQISIATPTLIYEIRSPSLLYTLTVLCLQGMPRSHIQFAH